VESQIVASKMVEERKKKH